jgi:hypothetical protein
MHLTGLFFLVKFKLARESGGYLNSVLANTRKPFVRSVEKRLNNVPEKRNSPPQRK